MNNSETQTVPSKRFGLPRPLAGALIGTLLFLTILLPLKFLNYNSLLLYRLALDLELPGRLTIVILAMVAKIGVPKGAVHLVSISISAIPAWIAGWQIGSPNKSTRISGIIFVVIYLLCIMLLGTLLAFLGI